MKSMIIDVVGLTGYGLLSAGAYLKFGLAFALMFSGAILLGGALLAAMRGKHAA